MTAEQKMKEIARLNKTIERATQSIKDAEAMKQAIQQMK